jgi:hypothetical protein
MDAQLWIDDAEMLTIEHSASVEDKLPLLIQSSVRGSDFEIVGNFNRSRRGNLGILTLSFIWNI